MEFHSIDQMKDDFKEVGLSSVYLDADLDFDEQARRNREYIAEGNESKLPPSLLQPDIRFDGQMAASSFQAVWTKLASTDLSDEKAKATKEIHDSTVQVLENSTASSSIFNKLPSYCVCGLSVNRLNRSRCSSRPLRSTTLVDEQLLIVALSKVAFAIATLCTGSCSTLSSDLLWMTVGDQAVMLLGISNGLTSQMIGQLLELSNDHLQGFPLAVVGLNFTQMILERVKQSKLNYIATKENSFVSCVNGIYRGSFIVFMRMWKSRNCSIGDFAAVSSEIKELIKRKPKQLLNMAILSHSA